MSICGNFDDLDRSKAAEFNPSREHCATCRFWFPDQDLQTDPNSTAELGFGFCRRQPPRLIERLVAMLCEPAPVGRAADFDDLFPISRHFEATAFPGTFHNEWCGEFQWHPSLKKMETPSC